MYKDALILVLLTSKDIQLRTRGILVMTREIAMMKSALFRSAHHSKSKTSKLEIQASWFLSKSSSSMLTNPKTVSVVCSVMK